jgi:Ca2+-binding EF-hand superfamily protein
MDKRNKGVVTYQDFLVGMDRKDTESSRRLFNLIDKDGSGEVDLKEFMLGLSHVTQSSQEERVQFAFNLFDSDKNGIIDRSELTKIVRMSSPLSAQPQWIERRVDEVYESLHLRRNLNIDFDTFLLLAKENPDLITPQVVGEFI